MRPLLLPLCLLALGGCDLLFGLSGEVVARDGGRDELPGGDAVSDGPAACPSIDVCEQSITHDEDGDCTADPCDLCPHLPGVDADQDGDNIGDRCDVISIAPSEARFESFATTTSMSVFPAASWTVVDDALQATAPGILKYAIHPVPNGYPSEIRTRIDMLGPTVNRGIALALDSPTTPMSGYVVAVTREGSTGNTVAVYALNRGSLMPLGSTAAVPGDVIDLQVFVGLQVSVTTINPMDETQRLGPFGVSATQENPINGGTYDGLVTDGPGPRFAYWYRSQNVSPP